MPLDPFFTSSAKDEFQEMKQKKRALAKAIQTYRVVHSHKKAYRAKILRKAAQSNDDVAIRHLVGGRPLLTGDQNHKSLVGFKPPKRKWDAKVKPNAST